MHDTADAVIEGDMQAIAAEANEALRALSGASMLLTGAGGFLGYYFTLALVRSARLLGLPPVELVALDLFGQGVPSWLGELAGPHLRIEVGDITTWQPSQPFAYVVHAASIASPTFYRARPIETMRANVMGLWRLLDWAVAPDVHAQLRKLLFFSTSEIYGDPPNAAIPTQESYRGHVSCTGPRACYDESKRFGETLCVNYHAEHNVPTVCVRPFNNYGPGLRLDDRRVLPDFARDVLEGRDVVLHSDGSPRRTFCYIKDAIVGYLRALVSGRPGEAYNIGSDAPEVSMREVAEKVVATAHDQWGYAGRVRFEASTDPQYLVDNPQRRCPVLDKARSELGYAPNVSLDDGIARALVWYRQAHQQTQKVSACA